MDTGAAALAPGLICVISGHRTDRGTGLKQERIVLPDDGQRLRAALERRHLALLLLALVAPALFLVPITHDEIWHVWIAEQMLHGARLYRDIIEVNPPLWFWMGVPLAASGLGPRAAVTSFIVMAIAVSLILTPAKYRLVSFTAIVILPLHDFGQREHFTLIATAPYVFLLARRAEGEPAKYPFLIGVFAALGLALKPYFAIVPIVLELTVRRHVRSETVSLALCAVAYAVAVPVVTPEYLTSVVPMLREAYPAFGGGPGVIMLVYAFVFAIAGIAIGRRTGTATSRALFFAALAFLPAAVFQAKGWAYQSLPARGFLFMAIVIDFIACRKKPLPDALLFGAALCAMLPLGFYSNGYAPEVERHLAGTRPGSSIVVLANNPAVSWPMVYDHGLRWELPEMSTWQVQALKESPELLPVARRLAMVGLKKHPDILLIDLDPRFYYQTLALLPNGYLKGYRLRLRTNRYASYVRADTAPGGK